MVGGTVTFRTEIRGNGVSFPACQIPSRESGIEHLDVESDGSAVSVVVHVRSAANPKEGRTIAATAAERVLDLLAVSQSLALGATTRTADALSPLNPTPGVLQVEGVECLMIAGNVRAVIGIRPDGVVRDLAQARSARAEAIFELYRSARQSMSRVEEFMHLYQLLLMLHGDSQVKVDRFIKAELPTVTETPDPRPAKKGALETVFTRLRNEFVHVRTNVNIANTKAEMAACVDALAKITARACALQV